jgi:hypothetical protein
MNIYMKPNVIASYLRKISTAIENSKNPSKNFVVQDLQKLIMAAKFSQSGVTNLGIVKIDETVEAVGSAAEDDPPMPYYESVTEAIEEYVNELKNGIDITSRMEDEGIGDYEYWGMKGRDVNIIFDMDLPDPIELELSFAEPRNPKLEQEWLKGYLYNGEKLQLHINTMHNVSDDAGEDSPRGYMGYDVTVKISWELTDHEGLVLVFSPISWKRIR